MKPNSTGIAARMMLSIDRVRICEVDLPLYFQTSVIT